MNYISGLIFMYGREKYFAGSAVKYRIKVRLADRAIDHRLVSVPWLESGMNVITRLVGLFAVSVSDPPLRFFLLAFRFFSAGSLSTSRRASLRCRLEVFEPFPPEELLFWFPLFLGSNLQSFVKFVRLLSRSASSLKHQAQPFVAEEVL